MNSYITNISLIDINKELCGQTGVLKFEKFKTIPIKPETNYIVPKILHFIWIGSPVSYIYVKNILTFVATNKDNYTYKLWVDHYTPDIDGVLICDIRKEFLQDDQFINRNIYDIEPNWGAKADILRYEIIYREGGIFTDIDAISVKPFDIYFQRSFVSHIGEPYNDICNGIFGFPAGSNYLKYVINCLKEVRTYNYDYASLPTKLRICLLTGPILFRQCFEFYNDPNIQMISQQILTLSKDNPDAYTYHTYDSTWWDKK